MRSRNNRYSCWRSRSARLDGADRDLHRHACVHHARSDWCIGRRRSCAAWDDIAFSALGKSFVLPLLCSPLVALALTVAIYPLFRFIRRSFDVTSA